jgi:hypothetical protein
MPRSIAVETRIVRVTNAVDGAQGSNSITAVFGEPSGTATNGLRFWILNEPLFRKKVTATSAQILSSQVIFSFSGRAGNASVLNWPPSGPEGIVIEALPRARNRQTEVAFQMETVADGSTNVFISARLQVPEHQGVFMIKEGYPVSTGVFVLPTVFEPQKKR